MKKYIRASKRTDDVRRYLDQCVRNVANYFYDHEVTSPEDFVSDYYVENICNDWEVEKRKKELEDALLNARLRQLGYHP